LPTEQLLKLITLNTSDKTQWTNHNLSQHLHLTASTGFVLHSIVLESGMSFFNQSQSTEKQTKSPTTSFGTLMITTQTNSFHGFSMILWPYEEIIKVTGVQLPQEILTLIQVSSHEGSHKKEITFSVEILFILKTDAN